MTGLGIEGSAGGWTLGSALRLGAKIANPGWAVFACL